MPKEKEVTNHPCHLLSLPSAKRFWCRHCMTVFEDAITRWRHSRSCRYGVVNNFMRRRELEAKALQNTTVLNPVEARLEQSIQMCDLAASSIPGEPDPSVHPQIVPGPESFTCFICHEKFASMEDMRAHVKDPCSNTKIITTRVPHPKHSVPVFIDAMRSWQPSLPQQQQASEIHHGFGQAHVQHQAQTSYKIEIQPQRDIEPHYDSASVSYDHGENTVSDSITPTNIYVNEQGETVIEVENLDLNTERGELSLAHLLTQLSQQGIVFDKTGSAHLQSKPEVAINGTSPSTTLYATHSVYEQSGEASVVDDEEGQPTAEDAANTLAQLAGFRGFTRLNQKTQEDKEFEQAQVQTVKSYKYHTSSAGPSRQYSLNAQPQINIKYEYQYSGTSSEPGPSVVTAQHMSLQQGVQTAAQDYEHVKVEQEVTDGTIDFYSDSSAASHYVTDNDGHQQMQVDPDSSIDGSKSDPVGSQSVLVQHYTVDIDESGHLINVPIEVPGQVVSEEAGSAAIIPNGNNSQESSESDQNPDDGEQIVDLVSSDGAQEDETNEEIDEFTIQTVSLQEIVDSDTSSLSFGRQPQADNVIEANIMNSLSPNVGNITVTTEKLESADQSVSEFIHPSVSHEEDIQPLLNDAQEVGTSHPTALYMVSSTGIVPVSSESA